MKAAPVTLKPDWQAIRLASARGVSDRTLAEAFGVTRVAIRQRASREKWPGRGTRKLVPRPVVRERESLARSGERAEEVVQANLAELCENGSLAGARLLHDLLVLAAREPESIRRLSDAGDVVTAVKGLRSAAGLDRDKGVQVNLALFGSGPAEIEV